MKFENSFSGLDNEEAGALTEDRSMSSGCLDSGKIPTANTDTGLSVCRMQVTSTAATQTWDEA